MDLSRFARTSALLLLVAVAAAPLRAQEMFSPFVPSAEDNVERMLRLAALKRGDVVVDLGSGDGRIVIGAAKAQTGVLGFGVDVDAKLVAESNAAAREQGLAQRVRFFRRNVFDADLSKVDVIFMWLFPELQRLLRTKILAEARPGTRVVTNLWDMGSWPPDAVDEGETAVRLWVVPARVAGNWNWTLNIRGGTHAFAAVLEQQFQKGEGVVRVAGNRRLLHDVKVKGMELSFNLLMALDKVGYTRCEFIGTVKGNQVTGKARLLLPSVADPNEYETIEIAWRAVRSRKSNYFGPTGVAVPGIPAESTIKLD